MYTVRAEESFAAAHYIKDYHGKCENLHGHNYRVRVYVRGESLGKGGMLIDFTVLKKILKNVLEEFDHKNLNDVRYFREEEPSAELIAYSIFSLIKEQLPESGGLYHLARVEVFETDKNLAKYCRKSKRLTGTSLLSPATAMTKQLLNTSQKKDFPQTGLK